MQLGVGGWVVGWLCLVVGLGWVGLLQGSNHVLGFQDFRVRVVESGVHLFFIYVCLCFAEACTLACMCSWGFLSAVPETVVTSGKIAAMTPWVHTHPSSPNISPCEACSLLG